MDILNRRNNDSFDLPKILLPTSYFLLLSFILFSMIMEYKDGLPRFFSLMFFVGMTIVYFIKKPKVKALSIFGFLMYFVWLNLSYPLNIGQVEEAYIFLPMIILCIYPGKLYSNFATIVVLFVFYTFTKDGQLGELIEDSVEVVTLNFISSVGLLFYIRISNQMKQYRRDSYTDYLTGLPNRKAFKNELAKLYNDKVTKQRAIITLNLDNFKKVNDRLGDETGDFLIIELSKRIELQVSDTVEVFRIGGDVFSLIIKDISLCSPKNLSTSILKDLSKVIVVNDKEISITGSIGIAISPDDGHSSTVLVRNSSIAMYRAKSRGKNTFAFYDENMEVDTIKRYQLEEDLKNAIGTEQLYLVYQPKVSLSSGEISGAEALIRWNHPELGNIQPLDFIEIAEESDLIIPLGRWIIDKVASQAKKWSEYGQSIRISLNVSAVQFNKDNIYNQIFMALKKHDLDSKYIEIEVTESALMENPDKYMKTLKSIRKLGVRISIDDFGVAYSSLNYLRHLPLDVLKIDKEFIDDCVNDKKDQMILKGIVDLGHNLELELIAEGVEDENQRAFLTSIDCDDFQGYLFSKPLEVEEFESLIKEHHSLLIDINIAPPA